MRLAMGCGDGVVVNIGSKALLLLAGQCRRYIAGQNAIECPAGLTDHSQGPRLFHPSRQLSGLTALRKRPCRPVLADERHSKHVGNDDQNKAARDAEGEPEHTVDGTDTTIQHGIGDVGGEQVNNDQYKQKDDRANRHLGNIDVHRLYGARELSGYLLC